MKTIYMQTETHISGFSPDQGEQACEQHDSLSSGQPVV